MSFSWKISINPKTLLILRNIATVELLDIYNNASYYNVRSQQQKKQNYVRYLAKWQLQLLLKSMIVLVILRQKCMLVVSRPAIWWVTLSIHQRNKTDRQTDGRQTVYTTLMARRSQHNNLVGCYHFKVNKIDWTTLLTINAVISPLKYLCWQWLWLPVDIVMCDVAIRRTWRLPRYSQLVWKLRNRHYVSCWRWLC